jgi:hypothetical protein
MRAARFAALFIVATGFSSLVVPHAMAAGKAEPGLTSPRRTVPDDPLAGLPSEGEQNDRSERGKPGAKGTRSCRIDAKAVDPRNVGDLRATLAFVARGPRAWPCPQPLADVRLVMTVDGSGRISEVRNAGSDGAVAGALAKRLVGKSISPRPQGPTEGTVVLSFAGKP